MKKHAEELMRKLQACIRAAVERGSIRSYCSLARRAGVDAPAVYKFMSRDIGSDRVQLAFFTVCELIYAVGGKVVIPKRADLKAGPEPEIGRMTVNDTISYLVSTGDKLDACLAESLKKRSYEAKKTREREQRELEDA